MDKTEAIEAWGKLSELKEAKKELSKIMKIIKNEIVIAYIEDHCIRCNKDVDNDIVEVKKDLDEYKKEGILLRKEENRLRRKLDG